ncbi:PepSY domain-containing protein [Paucihalobacter ruber]|uniref:PepSY domain-containing protein n=1 Tax=Paucihalobacter ruber TaxID=2567861 RepID=A0A506PDF1_9FLAO|nr:PepSY-associated TM helix domain-containing protein [Paucihalobacter ruber]TPV31893.1 PepSY domain-containing protein [Paucihalobacter ruber]
MNRRNHAYLLRNTRKAHRITGATLFSLFFVVSITALLLGWKKNSNGYLLPQTQQGTVVSAEKYISIDSVQEIAVKHFNNVFENANPGIDRIDIRPDKAVAKVLFENTYFEVQIDLGTGDILQTATRRSDFVENLHDGSILDVLFKTSNGVFKLIYTSIMSLALLLFTVSGFWLWYGPKVMRKAKSE